MPEWPHWFAIRLQQSRSAAIDAKKDGGQRNRFVRLWLSAQKRCGHRIAKQGRVLARGAGLQRQVACGCLYSDHQDGALRLQKRLRGPESGQEAGAGPADLQSHRIRLQA